MSITLITSRGSRFCRRSIRYYIFGGNERVYLYVKCASIAVLFRNSVIVSDDGEEIEDYSEMKVQCSINYSAYLFDRLKRNLWVNIKMQAHEKRQSCMNVFFCVCSLLRPTSGCWLALWIGLQVINGVLLYEEVVLSKL